jgi:GAF domain-containing protein
MEHQALEIASSVPAGSRNVSRSTVQCWSKLGGIKTNATLLLVVGEHITGVLQIVTAPGQTLSLDDLDALVIVANQLSLGIENARFFRQVGAEEQRLRAILSSTDDVVLSVDADGRLLIANAAGAPFGSAQPRDRCYQAILTDAQSRA